MVTTNRRDLCVGLSLLAAGAAALPFASEADATPTSGISAPATQAETVLSVQRVYRFDQLPVKKNAYGESRAVMRGVLPTGEAVEVHETTLLPGHRPHPPHKHRHSELMLIREGTIEFDNDGAFERVGPGGVIFAASNVMHGLKNVGESNAVYFVVAIGAESIPHDRPL
ncbi:MAG: cupin domain-containing protein [Acidobacteriaceae bacterium]